MAKGLTETQLENISDIERACSVLSLLGSSFIIATFCLSNAFHKPINRLVFYASFGNAMTNIGTLMSRNYIAASNSVGCQFQAFLIQMFMPADAFWTLAMAINVWLTFYCTFDAQRIRKLEILYLLCCYGIPLVPALVYIFVKSNGQRVYGNATLWCWVSPAWGVWRVATFYGPIWLIIAITMSIYVRAGRTIYENHRQLRNLSCADPFEPPSTTNDIVGSVLTERAEIIQQPRAIQMRAFYLNDDSKTICQAGEEIGTGTLADQRATLPKRVPRNCADESTASKRSERPGHMARHRRRNFNAGAWAYTKCAILFFTAMLITWIPSSANRVYSLLHAETTSVSLEYMSAFVLPLQGFWNCLIYVVTSWRACRSLAASLRPCWRSSSTSLAAVEDVSMKLGPVNVRQCACERWSQSHKPPCDHAMSKTESTADLVLRNKNLDDDKL